MNYLDDLITKKRLIWAASIILFINLLDTTVLYTCSVPIAHDFNIPVSAMTFPILSYITGTCIFIPLAAWLSNRYNRIHILILSLTIFGLFSILCGIASQEYTFSLFRFFQGIAISIGLATMMIIVLSICKDSELIKTMGNINILALFGMAMGPCVGAVFSYYLSWRLAFFINAPICIALIAALLPLRSDPQFDLSKQSQHENFDWTGFILLSAALIITTIAIEKITHAATTQNFLFLMTGISLIIIYVMIWVGRQSQNSIQKINSTLDLHVFTNHDFLYGIIINLLARSAMCGIPVLLGVVLQQLYHFSVIKAGIYLAIIAFAGILAKFCSAFIIKAGIYRSVTICVVLTGLSIVLLAPVQFWMTYHLLFLPCFIFGFAMSLLYTAMNSVMYISMPKNDIAHASNLGGILQQFAIGLGVVFAMSGFSFLSDKSLALSTFIRSTIPLENAYWTTCIFLGSLMMLNVIAGRAFKSVQHRKSINTDNPVFE